MRLDLVGDGEEVHELGLLLLVQEAGHEGELLWVRSFEVRELVLDEDDLADVVGHAVFELALVVGVLLVLGPKIEFVVAVVVSEADLVDVLDAVVDDAAFDTLIFLSFGFLQFLVLLFFEFDTLLAHLYNCLHDTRRFWKQFFRWSHVELKRERCEPDHEPLDLEVF